MGSRDFLRKDAVTDLCEQFVAGGAACSFSTNSRRLLKAAHSSFIPATCTLPTDFSVRIWVDRDDRVRPPWPKPYVRGLDHLVFAGFDEGSSILADLRTRRIVGRFSAGIALDPAYCQNVIFPILLTIVSASVGIAELHCACVAKDRDGVLLAGPSGAGKSTLAIALSQNGFGFLSDDRTFCSLQDGEPQAWGLPTRLKVRPDAVRWFGELRNRDLTDSLAGPPAFWLEPENFSAVKRVRQCRPTSLIFLQRGDKSEFQLSAMSSAEALHRLNGELMAELPDADAKRSCTIQKIAELPSWLLQYGGPPQAIARQISQHLARS